MAEGYRPKLHGIRRRGGTGWLFGGQRQFQQWQPELESYGQSEQQPCVAGAFRQMNIFSFQNVYLAYLRCRRNKRSTRNALKFEINAEENLLRLSEELRTHTYAPLPSVCFVTESPKVREIFAADFRDRIVHHLLVSYLEPIWERKFIYDSYACRKDKGTLAAVKRLQSFMRKITQDGSRKAFYLHLDIRSFFVSIHKQTLFDILTRKEKNPDILWLLKTVIFHDPSRSPVIKGPLSLFDQIPPHKSLFCTQNRTGLPIGNYTSQFFANVYLNELDQYVKHELNCPYYIRYVDDLILLTRNPDEAQEWEKRIEAFLQSRLKITLNSKRRKLAPVRNGCDFLGYIVRPTHLLVRRRAVNNLKQKLGQFEKKLHIQKKNIIIIRHTPEIIKQLESVLASYTGHFSHASAFWLTNSFFEKYPFLKNHFAVKNRKLIRTDKIPRFPNLRRQYRWFSRKHQDSFLFFQIGCFYEFYGKRAKTAGNLLGLQGEYTRPGLGTGKGFPIRSLNRYLKKTVPMAGYVVIVAQTGICAGRIVQRRVLAQMRNPQIV